MRTAGKTLLILALTLTSTACTYLKHASLQADYTRLQQTAPSQRNLKHMIDRPNFFVMGKTLDPHKLYREDSSSKAAAAFSSRYQQHELVDVMHDINIGTHFGMNLPEGDYDIVIFSDRNSNGIYEYDEAVGQRAITVNAQRYPARVITQLDIALQDAHPVPWSGGSTSSTNKATIEIIAKRRNDQQSSFFFPAGTIRSLDDPIFSKDMSTLGLYDPAAFLTQAPTLFMALEEEYAFKIPVIFVHGIGGSAREFEPLIEQLDRTRFKPWFFHYPSGADLDQMAQLFYEIFLSNQKVPVNDAYPMVIVAHSMGGLVVRESLNLMQKNARTHTTFISLATPFGGHPAALNVDNSLGLILPSWRDLNPEGEFIQRLYRQPLPNSVEHLLFYAYGNDSTVKLGDNSDGVVPLASQLQPQAQQQSQRQYGLNVNHTEILTSLEAIDKINGEIEQLNSNIPADHFIYARQGGFDVDQHSDYDAEETYYLNIYGCYMRALSEGLISPYDDGQATFTDMLRGKIAPKRKGLFATDNKAATAWLKYNSQTVPDFSRCDK